MNWVYEVMGNLQHNSMHVYLETPLCSVELTPGKCIQECSLRCYSEAYKHREQVLRNNQIRLFHTLHQQQQREVKRVVFYTNSCQACEIWISYYIEAIVHQNVGRRSKLLFHSFSSQQAFSVFRFHTLRLSCKKKWPSIRLWVKRLLTEN